MILSLSNSADHVIIDDECLFLLLKHNPNLSLYKDTNGSIKMWSIPWNNTFTLGKILLNQQECGGKLVDHKDRNKLNNKLNNLRIVTHSQNCQNRTKIKQTSSIYRNVGYHTGHKKWQVRITYKRKRICGGFFDCEINAAVKADDMMLEYYGDYANLNFPLYGA